MRVVINEAHVQRFRTISQVLFFISLGGMVFGFIYNWRSPTAAAQISCFLLPLLLFMTLTSVRLANLWVREPRPTTVLAESLKGLGRKYTIYHYLLPAPHVLIGPEGVFTLTTVWQDRAYSVKGKKWSEGGGIFRRLNGFLRQDALGNPFTVAYYQAEQVQKLINKIDPDSGVEVQPLVVFIGLHVTVDMEDPILPVLYADSKKKPSLRTYLRDQKAEDRKTLSVEALDKIDAMFGLVTREELEQQGIDAAAVDDEDEEEAPDTDADELEDVEAGDEEAGIVYVVRSGQLFKIGVTHGAIEEALKAEDADAGSPLRSSTPSKRPSRKVSRPPCSAALSGNARSQDGMVSAKKIYPGSSRCGESRSCAGMLRRLLILVALLGLTFGLRVYRLAAMPLRGDEAFSVRYWADSPSRVLIDTDQDAEDGLAHREPHPLGTFLGFWAWKQMAGDSEFAMRYLPLLGTLIGTAALYRLGRRLLRSERLAYLAAGLWAVNPFIIWHAQDVRNYALWAGFSPLAMMLFLRALDSDRRRDWVLYVLLEALALYTFFLEAFLLFVQALYLLLFRRSRLRHAVSAWSALGVLLIPWFIQVWWLAHSGYQGTTPEPSLPALLTRFLPTLLVGDALTNPWRVAAPLLWCGLVALALIVGTRTQSKLLFWLAAWVMIPTILLLITNARMNIFHPRYLIAVTPALLLLMARAIGAGTEARSGLRRGLVVVSLALLITPLVGFSYLRHYYAGENPKAGDWPRLIAYLTSRARPGDLILQVSADPAFGYYYRGSAAETSLIYGEDIAKQLDDELPHYHTIWLVGRFPPVETYLADHLQEISTHTISSFTVIQYRQRQVWPGEIAVPLDIRFGDIVRLKGYTLLGPDDGTQALTLLLYWEPLRQTEISYTVFTHLIGSTPSPSGSPLWDQDDHPPLGGVVPTTVWKPGELLRDSYQLLDSVQLAPGTYSLEAGFYDPADPNQRLPVSDASGNPLGDSYRLTTVIK